MELLQHKSPAIITQKNLLFLFCLCFFSPSPSPPSSMNLLLRDSDHSLLKSALYWHLYSTFPTLPLEAFYKAMNYMPVTHWIHSCTREVVITLLAIKLIMPPTIEFLYVCTKEIKLPSCPWYHEHIKGRRKNRELMMGRGMGPSPVWADNMLHILIHMGLWP